jgi:beta-phosphoglucomutase-like phosphatase (HAD superfamily)
MAATRLGRHAHARDRRPPWPPHGAVARGPRHRRRRSRPRGSVDPLPAVATNAKLSDRAQIERALARAALASYVSDVFCYLDLGVPKAEPAFWQAVVARLDVLPSDLLMVGDSLEQDVLGPLRCGIAAVWFNWKRAPIPPEPELHVIDRLADLPDLVDRLSAGDHFVRVT